MTSDQGGHQPKDPYAHGQACANQEQTQAVALGLQQNQTSQECTKAKAYQRRCGPGPAGAHSRGHTQEGWRNKSQTLQLHAPGGMTAKGGSSVKEEWDRRHYRQSHSVAISSSQQALNRLLCYTG